MADYVKPRYDLTKGSVAKILWQSSIPILISNIFEYLNSSINTIWIGRFLGPSALAATSNAGWIIFLMFSFVFGFGLAASAFIGQYNGRGEMESGRQVFGAAVGLVALLAVVSSAIGWYYCDTILIKLGTPDDVFKEAHDYLRVIFLALPPNLVLWVIMLSLRGIGDSTTAMWYMTLTVVLDIIFNPLLIGGLLGFPQLGIAGSAYATALANYVALFAQIAHLYLKRSPLSLRDAQLLYLFAPWEQIKRIVFKGIPICLQMLFMASSGLVMMRYVNREGTDTIAAYNVCQQLWVYLQLPGMAVSSGVGAMVSQNIGAGLWDRVYKATKVGVVVCAAMSLSLLVAFYLFDEKIFHLFLKESPHDVVLDIARHIQNIASLSYVLFGVATVYMATLRSNGVVMLPLIFTFIAVWPARFGFYYLFYSKLGADAIWYSFPAGTIVCVVLTYLYYLFGNWHKKSLI